jgi:hypothetical protein
MTDSEGILSRHHAEVAQIRGYVDLTEEAKERRISELTEKTNAEYAEAKEAEKRKVQERLESAKKAVYNVPTGATYFDAEAAQVHASFRSAWADVSFLSESDDISQALEQAERTGDPLLARAVYHRALDLDLQPVVERYLQSRPKEAKALERYTKATEEANQAKDISSLFSQALTERALQSSW